HSLCFLTIRPPPASPLFPYTTLFRSALGKPVHRRPARGSNRSLVIAAELAVVPARASLLDEANRNAFRRLLAQDVLVAAAVPGRSEEHTSETPVTVRSRMPSSA